MWLAHNVDAKAAELVAREAVAISETGTRPALLAAMSANRNIARSFSITFHRGTLGWALFQQARYADALRELDRAAGLRNQERARSRGLEYRRGMALEKLNRSSEAYSAYLHEIAFGTSTPETRAAIARVRPQGKEEDIRSGVNNLLTADVLENSQPIEDAREKLGRFELRGVDGKAVNLAQYAGKTMLIEFWATWCASCLRSMEHTQKLHKAFGEQLVVLAVSQDDEETRPRAAEYLRKKGYEFVLLYDEERRRDLHVGFVPARVLVDKTGLVRVREYGWTPAQEPVFEKKLRELLMEGRPH